MYMYIMSVQWLYISFLACSIDPDLKDELVEVIEKLLKDQTTVSPVLNSLNTLFNALLCVPFNATLCSLPQLVSGSVVMAFETVCPDRIDMIHKNYRKLCNLLMDVDEWGQVIILNMLTRYARTQFLDPNQEVNSV